MNQKTIIQAGVVVLGLAFLVFNTMRNLGVFKGAVQDAGGGAVMQTIDQTVTTTLQSTPLGKSINKFGSQMAEAGKAEEKPPADTEPLYSAFDIRPPFKSLLPQPPAPVIANAGQSNPYDETAMASEFANLPSGLRVNGTLLGGEFPLAIINRSVYAVGDEIEGARIQDIDLNGVTFEYQGAVTILPVPKDEIF